MTMPVLHRAIAAVAITMLVFSLIYVAQQIALTAVIPIPASAPRIAANKPGPLKAIATSATAGHGVTKVIGGTTRPAPPAPAKRQSL
jgi:hypothetical protein